MASKKVGISLSSYAVHRGVSRQAVYDAIKAERIIPEPDGSFIPEKADLQWDESTDPAKVRDTALRERGEIGRREADGATIHEFGIPAGRPGARSHAQVYQQAKAANEAIKVSRNRLAFEQSRHRLVDRPKAVADVFDALRNVRDAWQNWPARVSAQMAADLKVDAHAVQQALEKYVREHLEDLGEVVFAIRTDR